MAASDTTLVWHWKVYNIFISFLEYFTRNYYFSLAHIFVFGAVIWSWSFGQNRKRTVSNLPLYINILFIYSEQWPHSRNRKWPNDLDQLTIGVYWSHTYWQCPPSSSPTQRWSVSPPNSASFSPRTTVWKLKSRNNKSRSDHKKCCKSDDLWHFFEIKYKLGKFEHRNMSVFS